MCVMLLHLMCSCHFVRWLLGRSELSDSAFGKAGILRALQASGVAALSLLSLFATLALSILPGVMSVLGHLSILMLVVALNACGVSVILSDDAVSYAVYAFHALYFGTWIIHAIIARFFVVSNASMWTVRVCLNAIGMLGFCCSTVFLLVVSLLPWGRSAVLLQISQNSLLAFWTAFCTGVLFIFSPLIVSLMHSEESFYSLVQNFILHFLFLPSMWFDMQTFALSRLDDWTW